MRSRPDVNDRARAGDPVDPDAPGALAADPELARLGALLAEAATGSEVDRARAKAEVREVLARRADDAPAPVTRRLADLTPDPWDRMVARADGLESCLPVPWPDVAEILDPHARDGKALRPGVHVLVGGTGSGKTQLALALALAGARAGHPVFYVGLELDAVSVTARLAALLWGEGRTPTELDKLKAWSVLDWPRTRKGADALHDVRKAVADELAALPIRLVFGEARSADGGFTVADLGAVFTEAADAGTVAKPALVVVDFLQLLAGEKDNHDDREIRTRIARASYAASNAARDGKVAVLLVSATARENYKELRMEAGKLKNVKDLVGLGKESGEIEYAATSVLVIATVKGFPETLLLAVAKNRHGLDGWAALDWRHGTWPKDAPPGRLATVEAAKGDDTGEKRETQPKQKGAGRGGAPGGGFDPK